jgi:predicted GNAT superfamily acetyltransferase
MVMPPGADYSSPNYLYFCERHADFVYLDRVAITTDAQGRGIGPMLYREVERRSTAPWFALEVNVKPPNEGSMRFHAREGFVEVDRLETRPGKIVSLMMKPLR